jgi:hypothetical protein
MRTAVKRNIYKFVDMKLTAPILCAALFCSCSDNKAEIEKLESEIRRADARADSLGLVIIHEEIQLRNSGTDTTFNYAREHMRGIIVNLRRDSLNSARYSSALKKKVAELK